MRAAPYMRYSHEETAGMPTRHVIIAPMVLPCVGMNALRKRFVPCASNCDEGVLIHKPVL
jgi:hypothetical protein